ncbi:STAS domain-containing protein [Robbsia sp. Bb-Pol-6]|uniref:Anti-sigma factor antagonist n=1 Tax=Robbsia betulipollinis TaxID=2981849 RepID=A0ABT3ZL49_9BURK|nr:STAS domain-containing protein [Robbsia betulipollinis]MCY0387266.1 STAS domain-containing protein [Robbsia betulipollinis]
MQLEQESIGAHHVLRPVGRLDGIGAPLLEAAIERHVAEGGRQLVLDFSRLVYISSIGLRVVLMAGKRLPRAGGGVVLATLTPNVREVFEMSGFIALFPVFDDLATALASLPDGRMEEGVGGSAGA